MDSFGDNEKAQILRLLDTISSHLPFDDIYVSVCNKKQEVELSEETEDSLILLGVEQFNQIRKIRQCEDSVAFEKLCKYPPFNDEKIVEKLKRRLLDD